MSLIKKPGEIAPKSTVAVLIYGEPGSSKTTLACSAPNAVLFDYDGGVHRIHAAHRIPTVQISNWEMTQDALREVNESFPECQTVIIDTVGKMLDYMSAYIIARDPKMAQRDGSLQLKGYGIRKTMFINFIKQLAISGKNIIFVAHEREEKRGEETVKRPEIGGSSANDLIKELDLVGYVCLVGKIRTISFNPTESYYGKNTCNLPEVIKIPTIIDEAGNITGKNNFFEGIINLYQSNQAKSIELNREYDELINGFKEDIDSAKTCDDLNALCSSIASARHILDSKLKAGQMLNDRAAELKCKYDKSSRKYVAS